MLFRSPEWAERTLEEFDVTEEALHRVAVALKTKRPSQDAASLIAEAVEHLAEQRCRVGDIMSGMRETVSAVGVSDTEAEAARTRLEGVAAAAGCPTATWPGSPERCSRSASFNWSSDKARSSTALCDSSRRGRRRWPRTKWTGA